MPKNLFSFLRLCVLLLGFAVICSGAFCISTGSSACKCNNVPIAYFLLPLGFFLLISGIFWSTYHEASKHKSLFHRIIQQNPRFRDSHINTIDRYVWCGSVHNFVFWYYQPLFLSCTRLFRCLHPFPLCFIYPYLPLADFPSSFSLGIPTMCLATMCIPCIRCPLAYPEFVNFPFHLIHFTHALYHMLPFLSILPSIPVSHPHWTNILYIYSYTFLFLGPVCYRMSFLPYML